MFIFRADRRKEKSTVKIFLFTEKLIYVLLQRNDDEQG